MCCITYIACCTYVHIVQFYYSQACSIKESQDVHVHTYISQTLNKHVSTRPFPRLSVPSSGSHGVTGCSTTLSEPKGKKGGHPHVNHIDITLPVFVHNCAFITSLLPASLQSMWDHNTHLLCSNLISLYLGPSTQHHQPSFRVLCRTHRDRWLDTRSRGGGHQHMQLSVCLSRPQLDANRAI